MVLLDEHLSPANPLPHIILPPLDQPSAPHGHAHGAVHKLYPQGIQFIDQMAVVEGILAMLCGGGFLIFFWFFLLTLWGWGLSSHPTVIALCFALACLIAARPDFVGYRYQPVLFNRALGKVHVFLDEGTALWEFWRWFGFTRHSIHTYDWACVRAEVAQITVMGHSNFLRHETLLMLAFTEAPGSNRVIARVGVGYTDAYAGTDAATQRFEHIRRYMQEQGPPLAPGDHLYTDASKLSLWGAITWGQPLIGPGSFDYWTARALGNTNLWPLSVLFGLMCLMALPATIPAGLLRALSHWSKATPKWPPEILASVGGAALSHADVAALSSPPLRLGRSPGRYGPPVPPPSLKQKWAARKKRKAGNARF